jgi:hypothetical protein
MLDVDTFYRERDRRSNQYVGSAIPQPHIVVVAERVGRLASGQLLLLSMANQLARVFRHITFIVPDRNEPVLVRTPFSGTSLGEVLGETVHRIDPFGSFAIVDRALVDGPAISVGPSDELAKLQWYVGCSGSIAEISRSPVEVSDSPGSLRGAALAACLGANSVTRAAIGMPNVARRLSAWNFAEGAAADVGPDDVTPVDVGRVLMVGAGAVAGSAAYQLGVVGIGGEWTVLDRDVVKLHNTSRGMVFQASDAVEWSGAARSKVEAVGAALGQGVRLDKSWFDESRLAGDAYDVILALANERSFRHLVSTRRENVVLQATTSSNWSSQVHRHVLGRDGCVFCRTGRLEPVSFGCSTGTVVRDDGTSEDAALPFLSAAAGLMLVTMLERLQRGQLIALPGNGWAWDFHSTNQMARSFTYSCQEDCDRVRSGSTRVSVRGDRRWAELSGAR